MQSSIQKPHGCDTLQLAPPSAPISLAKKRPNFDARSYGNCLNLLDRADDIEFHYVILCREPLRWQVQLTIKVLSAVPAWNHVSERQIGIADKTLLD